MNRISVCFVCIFFVFLLIGCNSYSHTEIVDYNIDSDENPVHEISNEVIPDNNNFENEIAEDAKETVEAEIEEIEVGDEIEEDEMEVVINPVEIPASEFVFRDVFGEEYSVLINKYVPLCPYDKTKFVHTDNKVYYEDSEYVSRLGLDVSRHIGKVNWDEVKEEGFEFVIIRLGYRTYGKSAGNLNLDKNYLTNIRGAIDSGLDVGVYIYSQAINEEEAIEEADFVIDNLENNDLKVDLPIVYDPESVLNDVARTDDVTPEQFTLNAIAFCNRVKDRGYEPMIYANMLWEAYNLDLSRLPDVPLWYADYEDVPQTPYMFEFWQYTNEGKVKGVHDALVDIDIQIIKK